MDKEKLFDQATVDRFVFTMQKLAMVTALDEFGILLNGERFKWEALERAGLTAVRSILRVACKEDPLCRYPANWWEAVKERWLPKCLRKRFPVRYREVMATHIFPEIDPPTSVLGREFVQLRVIDMWKVEDLLRKNEN